ncbi:hypothetical protein FQZ97_1064540 [compost metagenome]
MEPGLSTCPGVLPICAVVSVWPKPSRRSRPQASRMCSMISGFIGSPAPTSSRRDRRDWYAARSSCTSMRQTVGGAQRLVMPWLARVSSRPLAEKRGTS